MPTRTKMKRRPSTVMSILIVLGVTFYLPIWIHVHFMHMKDDVTTDSSPSLSSSYKLGIPSLESFIEQSRGGILSGKANGSNKQDNAIVIQELQDRVQYLETKLNAYLAYTSDPFLSTKKPAKCNNMKAIKDIACQDNKSCELDNQMVCLDTFPNLANVKSRQESSCVVYDFGIRESPEYGLAFAEDPFHCNVVGFDPSPISLDWWKKNQKQIQQKYPTYQFIGVGAGGIDGDLELREYDWGQVSIIEFPTRVVDTTNCTAGACKYKFHAQQKSFNIPVRNLQTLMKQLGHNHINLLKLDVEGSEYTFLEKMIDDYSCRKVDQLTLEWHHYDFDRRYGVTSNPQINVLVALLKERCGLEQYWVHGSKGWPSNQKIYAEMGMNLYYTLTSFKRTKWHF